MRRRGGIRRACEAGAIGLLVLLAGCAALRGKAGDPLASVWGWRMPPFADDMDVASLRLALERTIAVAQRKGDATAAANARRLLDILSIHDLRARRDAITEQFQVRRLRDPLLLTAYYEPELVARRTPDDRFRYPVYARPPDLIDVDPRELDPTCHCRLQAGRLVNAKIVPYLSRGDIDRGALANRGLELAWVSDPVGLFSLHIQGSGLLRLPDGSRVAAKFAGTNGRPYTSLGKEMLARGMLNGGATWDRIRDAMLGMTDDERRRLFAMNERFTFFKLDDGRAAGSYGAELVPGRSIAVDPKVVPLGALVYLQTPSANRFVVAHDTGVAIKNAHADLFMGDGPEAEYRAGRTKENGTLYVLLPK